MRSLSLFSGIGGFDIAAERCGIKIAGFVEKDKFCQKVLKKHWPNVKLLEDIHDVRGNEFGAIDFIYGGPPCQPASCAGKRRGTEDDRWLWGEAIRLVKVCKPRWFLFENPTGILSLQGGIPFDNLLSELENEGYSNYIDKNGRKRIATFTLPACAVNAPHRRDRVWIVANRKSREAHAAEPGGLHAEPCGPDSDVAHADRFNGDDAGPYAGEVSQLQEAEVCGGEFDTNSDNERLQGHGEHGERVSQCSIGAGTWQEPWLEAATRLCRVDDGLPRQVDRVARLKALGNAVVPQIVEVIGRAIMKAEYP
jgi:DNA (cytosine-5)-methyltransferase 1